MIALLNRASLGVAYGLMCLSLNLLGTGSVLAAVNFLC